MSAAGWNVQGGEGGEGRAEAVPRDEQGARAILQKLCDRLPRAEFVGLQKTRMHAAAVAKVGLQRVEITDQVVEPVRFRAAKREHGQTMEQHSWPRTPGFRASGTTARRIALANESDQRKSRCGPGQR